MVPWPDPAAPACAPGDAIPLFNNQKKDQICSNPGLSERTKKRKTTPFFFSSLLAISHAPPRKN